MCSNRVSFEKKLLGKAVSWMNDLKAKFSFSHSDEK